MNGRTVRVASGGNDEVNAARVKAEAFVMFAFESPALGKTTR